MARAAPRQPASGTRISIALRRAARQLTASVAASKAPSTVNDVAMLTANRSSVAPMTHAM